MDVEENVLFFFWGFMFESCSAVDIILNLSPKNVKRLSFKLQKVATGNHTCKYGARTSFVLDTNPRKILKQQD